MDRDGLERGRGPVRIRFLHFLGDRKRVHVFVALDHVVIIGTTPAFRRDSASCSAGLLAHRVASLSVTTRFWSAAITQGMELSRKYISPTPAQLQPMEGNGLGYGSLFIESKVWLLK